MSSVLSSESLFVRVVTMFMFSVYFRHEGFQPSIAQARNKQKQTVADINRVIRTQRTQTGTYMYPHVILCWVVKAEDLFFPRSWSELRAQIIFVGIDSELVASGLSGPWVERLLPILTQRASNRPGTAIEPGNPPPEGVPETPLRPPSQAASGLSCE